MSSFRPLLAFALLASALAAHAGTIHPNLAARLAATPEEGEVAVIVEMEARANPAAAAATAARNDRRARGRAVVAELRSHSDRTQGSIRAALAQERSSGQAKTVRPFWVFNGLAVTARPEVIRKLANRNDVKEVRLDVAIAPPRMVRSSTPSPASTAPPVWNIEMVRAPEVWTLGHSGTGVVVGSFDTGVDGTHPDLASRYRGNHAISWFDPYGEHSAPYDNNGHGTHTTGTMVGGDYSGNSIGVAPGARWIAAKGWNDAADATASAFHEIFEWFLAPGGDPANAPDIVNSSWGMTPTECDLEFRPDILAFRAAGIVPVFASGNSGPLPSSALAPGMYPESFSVGATDFFDDVVSFSGMGPSMCDGGVKPDVSAPGVAVLSTLPGGFHWELDGTSMAAPHVSGAAAILRSIDPTLTVEAIESLIAEGSVDLGPPGPDDAFGAGRLDVLQSASLALGISLVGIESTAGASETGLVGRFTVTRRGSTSDAVTIPYTVGGTAAAGADYVALPGSITLPPGVASGTIDVTPHDDALVELTETVIVTLTPGTGYLASPAQATVSLTSDEIPPDLVVTTLTVPATAGAGLPVTVTDTTRNQGAAPSEASSTAFYLSSNPTFDAADVRLGQRAVPALAAGASSTASTTFTLPAGLAAGTWYLVARADGDDLLVETQEGNNTNYRNLMVGPDLQLTAVTIPADGGAGFALVVGDTTRNSGAGAADASSTSYYLSVDAVFDAGDVLLGSRAVPSLAAGGTNAGSISVTLPAGLATGSYTIIARADAAGAVGETYENNNSLSRAIRVGPDLTVSSLVAPASGGAGATVAVTDTTRNAGAGAAPASTTRFYLSSNGTLDAGDVLLGSRSVAALAPGGTDTGTTSLAIPAGTGGGTYYLIAKADGVEALVETQEGNNLANRILAIGSDLAVTALTVPATAGAGLAIAVTDTTRNQAAGGAGASTTRYYLSANATWDAGDTLLGSRAVPALDANASSSGAVTLVIPAGTPTGSYTLIARADADGAVSELNEANNTLGRLLRIGPDLVLVSLTAPTTAAAGASIAVGDTTRNTGAGATPGSTTRYYLSADWILDAADVEVASRAVAALDPNASDTGSTSIVLPASLAAGTHYLIAKADGPDVVAETQETNNTAYRALMVGPDLQFSALTVPGSVASGGTFAVSDTARNAGAGAAGTTTVRYYLSTNGTLDAFDIPLGSREVPALAAGATHAGTASLVVPPGTPAGYYSLLAKVDGDGVVAETYENNNVMSRGITVAP
jgi:subtilase family serine protease/subtilisin family serine protease